MASNTESDYIKPLVWCPQCANCRFEDNEAYCHSTDGRWVKLPAVAIEQAGYCPRFEQKEVSKDR